MKHVKTFGLPLTLPMMTSACVTRRQDSRCQVFLRHFYTALVPGKSKKAHRIAPFSLPNSSYFPSPFLYTGSTDGCGSMGKQVLASCIAVHAGTQDIPSTGTSTPLSSAALSSTPNILPLYLPCNLSETDQVMGSSEITKIAQFLSSRLISGRVMDDTFENSLPWRYSCKVL